MSWPTKRCSTCAARCVGIRVETIMNYQVHYTVTINAMLVAYDPVIVFDMLARGIKVKPRPIVVF